MNKALAFLERAVGDDDDQPLMAFVADDDSRRAVLDAATRHGWENVTAEVGDITVAVAKLETTSSPKRLLIDLSASEDAFADLNALAEVCEPGTAVVAIGSINDITFYRSLIEAGISDYLLKPVDVDALARALERAGEAPAMESAAPRKQGRLVAVLGSRGGVGASTVAINCAWLMAHHHKIKTALVDLDLQLGTAAMALDLEPGRGLTEVLQNPSRIDGLFVERAIVKESDHLSVLCAEQSLDDDPNVDPAAVDILLGELRANFDCVVVDLPRHMSAMSRRVLGAASHVSIVADPTVASVRDTIRLLATAKRAGPEARISVVLNRVGAAGKGEVGRAELERGIEAKIDFILPYVAKLAAEAANAGKSLPAVEKNGKVSKVLDAMALDMSGKKEKRKASKPALGWLAKRKAKK